jgi:hypothetical protein
MISRVIRTNTTTYSNDFDQKDGHKELARNLTTQVTTGLNFCATRESLYGTEFSQAAAQTIYTRPRMAKLDLNRLPPEYASSITPSFQPATARTEHQHYYGVCGEAPSVKRSVLKSRSLSKETRALVSGTTRATHHPPNYDAHIPSEWQGNRGKQVHPDRSLEDMTWQYHTKMPGYTGYIPGRDVIPPMNRSPTTYRAMCDDLRYVAP